MIQVDKEFSTVESKEGGGYVQPPPGGYVFQVIDVSELPSQRGEAMVTLSLDIAEGEYDGAFEKYPKKFFQRVNGEQLPYFKAMLEYFKASNSAERLRGVLSPAYEFDGSKLKGCLIGGALGEVEYVNKAGQKAVGVEVRWLCAVKDVGLVKPPKMKPLAESSHQPAKSASKASPAAPMPEDELPF